MRSDSVLVDKKADILDSILGKPYFEIEGVRLYLGDCVALLKQMPGGLIDLSVTSPPTT